jgi:hypothetical protein
LYRRESPSLPWPVVWMAHAKSASLHTSVNDASEFFHCAKTASTLDDIFECGVGKCQWEVWCVRDSTQKIFRWITSKLKLPYWNS